MSPLASWAVFGGVLIAAAIFAWWLWAPEMYDLGDSEPVDDFELWEQESAEYRRIQRAQFFDQEAGL